MVKETQLFSQQFIIKNQERPPSKHKYNPGTSKQENNTKKGCFKCGRTNHIARDCRASQRDQDKYKASQQNAENKDKMVLICRYCRKECHELEECRKKKYVNSKKKPAAKEALTEKQNAGNEEEPNAISARSVQQIQSAVLSLQRPSTSQ